MIFTFFPFFQKNARGVSLFRPGFSLYNALCMPMGRMDEAFNPRPGRVRIQPRRPAAAQHKELHIALRPQDRGHIQPHHRKIRRLPDKGGYLPQHGPVGLRPLYDAALSNRSTAGLKLRLHQSH